MIALLTGIGAAAIFAAMVLALREMSREWPPEHAPLTDESYADALAVNSPDGSEITADDIAWLWSVGADMGDSQ